jgi:serine protease Do
VNEDGPAARAGLKNEDVIASVDGKPVDTTESLIQMISRHRPGDTVTLGVFRCRESGGEGCDAREVTLKVKLADRSETLQAANEGSDEEEGSADEDKPASVAKLGFTVAELTPNRFRELYAGQAELPRTHPDGVIVTKVSSSGPAYEAGLQAGWIVTQLGRDPIKSVADFRRAADRIQKGQVVRLAVSYFLPPSQRGDGLQQESRFIFFEAE